MRKGTEVKFEKGTEVNVKKKYGIRCQKYGKNAKKSGKKTENGKGKFKRKGKVGGKYKE